MITNQAVVNYIMDAVSKTAPAKPENIDDAESALASMKRAFVGGEDG